ncbi:F0F1 ATP synthase subunit delta [Celerinatantimonas sp. YJH-8]|uniref:F0F1 ATP synthase subunit delta n=1 Tax=Celerinatantimonas sp. YJH-8 TaxID=3228714 RepID=UPI0038CA9D86
MAEEKTIARPYAKAAFEYAVEHEAIDNWATMLGFASEVAKDQQVVEFLTNADKTQLMADFFISVCGEQLDEHGQNFIRVMAENKRLGVLPSVCDEFLELQAEHLKQITVRVTSATELSKPQLQTLTEALEKRLARSVQLDCCVDSSLIAGMVITAGDLVIDSSVKGQLSKLSDTLKA